MTLASHTAARLGSLQSGRSFGTIPMAIKSSPELCCSVSGFVKITNDNSKVTAFLAVVTCIEMLNCQKMCPVS